MIWRGLVMLAVSRWFSGWSGCLVVGAGLGDRRADAGVVDDVLALGVAGQQRVPGHVVDLARLAAGGVMDGGERVVGE